MAIKDKSSIVFSIVATIISMVSLSVSIRSCRLEERVKKLHLKPELTCILNHDLKQPPFFLFVLKNEGPIDAINVSVHHYIFAYLQAERKIRASFADAKKYDLPGSFIFNDALRPNKYIQKQTGGYSYRTLLSSISSCLISRSSERVMGNYFRRDVPITLMVRLSTVRKSFEFILIIKRLLLS